MCSQHIQKPRRLLNRKFTYIGNLSKQHIGISIVDSLLMGNFYSLLVTSVWWK